MTTSPQDRAADAFAAELAHWRVERGLSKKQLAVGMGFDPSYVSHVEGRRHRPTDDFARRADAVLQADGAIWRRFVEYDELRRGRAAVAAGPDQWLPPGAGLVVEREVAALSFVDGIYYCSVTRELYNAGIDPVTRYPVRVSVDRYPGDPERSNRYYREHPLTWDELRLSGSCLPGPPPALDLSTSPNPAVLDPAGPDRAIPGPEGSVPAGTDRAILDLEGPVPAGTLLAGPGSASAEAEPMEWRAIHDRDSFKEVWLLFENDQSRFPLYRGQRATIRYRYQVGEDKWGQWFQRAVRLPTRRLVIQLDFPASTAPAVWGVQTSLTAESPLRTPVEQVVTNGRAVFEWATDNPPLNARYRLQWRFRSRGPAPRAGRAVAGRSGEPLRASERMRAAGIVQRGSAGANRSDPAVDHPTDSTMLRVPAQGFDLPTQEPIAREVVQRLLTKLERIGELHEFGKGRGLAAPQLALPWAAAVVRPPDRGEPPVILLNPRVIGESSDTDEQYEGCLSFFDVRGLVRRPLRIEVEHATFRGERVITAFERGLARLVAHEIDHLEGRLYTDRMEPGVRLVPVSEYRGTGSPWRYD